MPANRPPWTSTGIKLEPGDRVSVFCFGQAWLEANPSVWVGAHFALWIRTSARGPVFRACRGSRTFTADAQGELQMANLFPGAWADPTGALASPAQIYERVASGFEVLVIRWQADPQAGLARLVAGGGPATKRFAAELAALRNPKRTPSGWKYLWEVGEAEAFETTLEGAIRCEIADDAAILQKAASAPLTPETRLRWRRNSAFVVRFRHGVTAKRIWLFVAAPKIWGAGLTRSARSGRTTGGRSESRPHGLWRCG
jgi:hypothetical protein